MNSTNVLPIQVNVSTPSEEVIQFRYFGLSIGFFTIIVGGIGNILTILTFTTSKKLNTSFVSFLINLSVVDLITSTFMLPLNVAGYLHMRWPFGDDSWTTRLQAYSYFCCGYTSIVFLVAITTNRLIGAVYPHEYKHIFTKKRIRVMLVFCWTCAPAFLFPFLVGWHSDCNSPNHALTGWRSSQLLCTFVCLNSAWLPYMQFIRVLFQFLPLIYMVVAYSLILIKVRRSPANRKMVAQGACQGNSRRKSSTIALIRNMNDETRMLLVSVIICAGFMVTFLPSVVVNLIPKSVHVDTRYHMAASNLSWLNSSINPIVYVALNKRYRKEYERTLRLLSGRSSVQSNVYTNGQQQLEKSEAS